MALDYVSIGQKVRANRKRKGLSQLKLSELINLSPTYVSYIESGSKSMSLNTFVLLANALNITADELLADSLENRIKVSNHEFTTLLADCNEHEKKVLLDITAKIKHSLRENKWFASSRL